MEISALTTSMKMGQLQHSIPQELQVQVLRWLPPRDRIRSCARACRTLRAATLASTSELSLQQLTQRQADAVAIWLGRHGSSPLKHMNLCGTYNLRPHICLPWNNLDQLQVLHLSMLSLQDSSSTSGQSQAPTHSSTEQSSGSSSSIDSSRSTLSACRQLTHLQLEYCDLSVLGVGLSQLTGLTALQWLRIDSALSTASAGQSSSSLTAAFSTALGTTLGQLTQLTALALEAGGPITMSGAVLAAASGLSHLQDLVLRSIGTQEEPVRLDQLPSSLTVLDVYYGWATCEAADGNGMRPLPAVAQLSLSNVRGLRCTVLSCMSQLTDLRYVAEEQMTHMLAVLCELQQLQHLVIEDVEEAAAPAAYATLTASSQLSHLRVSCCGMAAAAVQHMFAPGLLLPDLQHICIENESYWSSPYCEDLWEEGPAGLEAKSLVLGPGDAALLAASCPALQDLTFLAVQEGVAACGLAPLLQLRALTCLGIGGAGCDDNVAAHILAKMTGLHRLVIWCSPNLTAAGLAHLTALIALDNLSVNGADTRYHPSSGAGVDGGAACREDVHLSWQPDYAWDEPAVWMQLQQLCSRSPAALAVINMNAQQQLLAKELLLQERERQLREAQQQHCAELQRRDEQLAAAQALIADLEQQLRVQKSNAKE